MSCVLEENKLKKAPDLDKWTAMQPWKFSKRKFRTNRTNTV